MTPEQIQKLHRIKARCEELLAIADKRTPGEWELETEQSGGIFAKNAKPVPNHVLLYEGAYLDNEDAIFIASCAGPAESGWRSTIAAINALGRGTSSLWPPEVQNYCSLVLKDILAAWPDEIL